MDKLIRALVAGSFTVSVLAACSSAGGSFVPAPTGSGVPSSGGSSGGSVGSGTDPGGGSGVASDRPGSSVPADQGPPEGGRATIVIPQPGRLDVHPVGATRIETTVTGRRVVVRLSWWSGVAPCSVLDSVGQTRAGSDIRLTILEGSDRRGIVCIEIAMFKATVVDLGELPAGTYTVSAGGQAPPARVVVY